VEAPTGMELYALQSTVERDTPKFDAKFVRITSFATMSYESFGFHTMYAVKCAQLLYVKHEVVE
jgi:hypothetical protein